MDEWLRTDVSYEERIDHLLNEGGLSDPYLFNSATVSGNGAGTRSRESPAGIGSSAT
jgi:hypothetical protein